MIYAHCFDTAHQVQILKKTKNRYGTLKRKQSNIHFKLQKVQYFVNVYKVYCTKSRSVGAEVVRKVWVEALETKLPLPGP